jgi:hypothetical protein
VQPLSTVPFNLTKTPISTQRSLTTEANPDKRPASGGARFSWHEQRPKLIAHITMASVGNASTRSSEARRVSDKYQRIWAVAKSSACMRRGTERLLQTPNVPSSTTYLVDPTVRQPKQPYPPEAEGPVSQRAQLRAPAHQPFLLVALPLSSSSSLQSVSAQTPTLTHAITTAATTPTKPGQFSLSLAVLHISSSPALSSSLHPHTCLDSSLVARFAGNSSSSPLLFASLVTR